MPGPPSNRRGEEVPEFLTAFAPPGGSDGDSEEDDYGGLRTPSDYGDTPISEGDESDEEEGHDAGRDGGGSLLLLDGGASSEGGASVHAAELAGGGAGGGGMDLDAPLGRAADCDICCEPFGAEGSASARLYLGCEHAMCVGCVARHASSAADLPIAPHDPSRLRCLHEGCLGTASPSQLAPALGQQGAAALARRLSEYERAHTLTAPCPMCGAEARAPWSDAVEGATVVECESCGTPYCFHCLSHTPPPVCVHQCHEGPPTDNTFSHFICRGNGGVMRHFEVPPARVLARLEELCAGPPAARCPCCTTPMARTVECEQLAHCSVSACNHCGYFSLPGSAMVDHYGSGASWADHRCPRYAFSGGQLTQWWRSRLPAGMMPCRRGAEGCTSEDHDCRRPDHARFREWSERVRRRVFVRALMESLPPTLMGSVLDLAGVMASPQLHAELAGVRREQAANAPPGTGW
ncbi:MAG: hypothetical protein VYE81_03045 [Planctomycetota bacterium]|nr:hypothetical protein [Planctomycetota bacterium]